MIDGCAFQEVKKFDALRTKPFFAKILRADAYLSEVTRVRAGIRAPQ